MIFGKKFKTGNLEGITIDSLKTFIAALGILQERSNALEEIYILSEKILRKLRPNSPIIGSEDREEPKKIIDNGLIDSLYLVAKNIDKESFKIKENLEIIDSIIGDM